MVMNEKSRFLVCCIEGLCSLRYFQFPFPKDIELLALWLMINIEYKMLANGLFLKFDSGNLHLDYNK